MTNSAFGTVFGVVDGSRIPCATMPGLRRSVLDIGAAPASPDHRPVL